MSAWLRSPRSKARERRRRDRIFPRQLSVADGNVCHGYDDESFANGRLPSHVLRREKRTRIWKRQVWNLSPPGRAMGPTIGARM
jgi:hypothetical protein